MADGLYIPTFVADSNFKPAIIQPRQFFYNGRKDVSPSWILGGLDPLNPGGTTYTPYTNFPYVDHYSGSASSVVPDENSESLLFFNEQTAYGVAPSETLYSKYWETYVRLLYNPRTRLIDCEAVIPFAQYVDLELNDIITYKNKYYHLRAVNDYNLQTGECKLQLLGPILGDALYP